MLASILFANQHRAREFLEVSLNADGGGKRERE
jgi:hypothetical protein